MAFSDILFDRSLRALVKPYLNQVRFDRAGLSLLRQSAELSLGMLSLGRTGVGSWDESIGPVEVEILEPLKSKPKANLLYFPGGAYFLGSPRTHRNLTARLCRQSNLRVIVVDYRKAPEFIFPSQLFDALSVYQWLLKRPEAKDPIFFGGDSAGGHLAILTVLESLKKGLPSPKGLICLSPWTDMSCPREGRFYDSWDPLIPFKKLQEAAAMILGGANPYSELVSPVYASLHSLPPTLVQAIPTELLFHDSTRFVAKAQHDGADARLSTWHDVPHVFQLLAPFISKAGLALAEIGDFISEHLQQVD